MNDCWTIFSSGYAKVFPLFSFGFKSTVFKHKYHLIIQYKMAEPSSSELETPTKSQVIYRCKKCRRIVASKENIVSHERGKGESSFKWNKRSSESWETEKQPADCTSIFVEPMKWMQAVQEGHVEEKLLCMGCNARLGYFNWAGMQCSCGAWVNPAFQLHKSRLDECYL